MSLKAGMPDLRRTFCVVGMDGSALPRTMSGPWFPPRVLFDGVVSRPPSPPLAVAVGVGVKIADKSRLGAGACTGLGATLFDDLVGDAGMSFTCCVQHESASATIFAASSVLRTLSRFVVAAFLLFGCCSTSTTSSSCVYAPHATISVLFDGVSKTGTLFKMCHAIR